MKRIGPVGLLFLALVACHGEGAPPVYPQYTPAEAALFDNSIEPAALRDGAKPTSRDWDAKLIERTQRADAVVQATIVTVERHAGGGYGIEARIEGRLAGRAPGARVDLFLGSGSDAARRLDHGAHLVGRRVILFLRTHASPDGSAVHFRAEPDTQEVATAIRNAAMTLDATGD